MTNNHDLASGLMSLAIVLGVYFLPAIVALHRNHQNVGPIAIINIFLGWTFIGWVVALAMAASAVKKVAKA